MNIIYIDQKDQQYVVEGLAGQTVMEVAYQNKIPGILAECGGACACATCHIYVDEAWLSKLKTMDDMEDVMLDVTIDRRSNSRLACQVKLSESLDGITVRVANNTL